MKNYLFTDTKTRLFKNCLICNKYFRVKRNTFGKYCSRICFYHADKDANMGKKISLAHITKGTFRGEKNWMFGKTHTKEARAKISKAQKGRIRSIKWKQRQSEKIKKLWKEGKYDAIKGKHNSPRTEFKKGWKNEKLIKKMLQGLMKRPTSLEKKMIEIIKKNNLPYKYVGNGSYLIGYKNPDFININGEKKLIEVANTFHHKSDYIQKRSKHFARYGWKSYIFLTNNLIEKDVLMILKS